MRIIDVRDLNDYAGIQTEINRIAVRAIIIKDGKIALIRSEKYGELKFPGGGMEVGESDIDTLVRETKEESGLNVIRDSIKFYGSTFIKRKSAFNENEIFRMESRYYLCDVEEKIDKPSLTDYEIEYGYKLVFLPIEEAISIQKEVLKKVLPEIEYVRRELIVLEDVMKILFNDKY